MLPDNWGRGKRFIKRGNGLGPGIGAWLHIQQEMKENKAKKKMGRSRGPGLFKILDKPLSQIHWDGNVGMWVDKTNYKSAFQCGRAYCRALVKRGFIEIGDGAYSSVFAHPKWENKVLKVSRRIDPWPEYIQWAYANGHQKFAPGVHSYKFYPGKPPTPDSTNYAPFYVAIVEKLKTDGGWRGEGSEVELAGDLFSKLMSSPHPTTEVLADLYLPGIVKFTQDFRTRFYKDENGKSRDYTLDCFGGNQMLSVDGKRWVLNDPLCGRHMDESCLSWRKKDDTRRSSLAA